MLISSHVPVGAVLGARIRRPLPALVAGFASHLLMDALPHWGTGSLEGDGWIPVARRDGVTGLLTIAVLTAAAPRDRRVALLAGVAGACLPDTDKIGIYFAGGSPWPASFDRFHSAIQREAPHRLPTDVAVAAALIATATAVLRLVRTPRGASCAAPRAPAAAASTAAGRR